MGWRAGGHADRKRKQVTAGVTKSGRGANARKKKNLPSSIYPDPEQEPESPQPTTGRTGIVSVNGRDVERMHCRQS